MRRVSGPGAAVERCPFPPRAGSEGRFGGRSWAGAEDGRRLLERTGGGGSAVAVPSVAAVVPPPDVAPALCRTLPCTACRPATRGFRSSSFSRKGWLSGTPTQGQPPPGTLDFAPWHGRADKGISPPGVRWVQRGPLLGACGPGTPPGESCVCWGPAHCQTRCGGAAWPLLLGAPTPPEPGDPGESQQEGWGRGWALFAAWLVTWGDGAGEELESGEGILGRGVVCSGCPFDQ